MSGRATAPVAMILAAGHASRLRPLTDTRAKAVVPFLNRPLMDYTLDWLRRAGFREVVVNVHHAGASILRAYGTRAFEMTIRYSCEERLLGTGGGPRRVIDLLGDRALLVNGDVVAGLATGPLLRRHRESDALATLGLYRGSWSRDYPQVTATATGRLLAFPGDPVPEEGSGSVVSGVFSGLHCVERSALELLPEGVPCGIVDPLYRELLNEGLPLGAVSLPGIWYEIGDPVRYLEAQLRALAREELPLALAGQVRRGRGAFVSRHSHLENVRLEPPYLLAAGTRVLQGATLQGVVAGDRVRIGHGARLEEVVAWSDASVGSGARLSRVVVEEGVRVPPRTEAEEVVLTASGPVPLTAALESRGTA